MGVYCRGGRRTVTVLRIFLQSHGWETLIVGDSEQMEGMSTMTRTVIVTITWTRVQDPFGVTSAYALAVEPDNATPLVQGSTLVPGEKNGTASVTLSFSDTAPFGFVQWQIYANTIAPVHAGEINAANFPGCPYP